MIKLALGLTGYGFNGKENDNEVKGEGAQQDYGLRIYDPRLGKFLSVDPLSKKYPFYTPYQFAGNTPIQAIDIDGGEPGVFWLMDTYLEWKFGDPTGMKTQTSGIESQIAIETRSTSYHNDNVPEKDQVRLDAMYKRQADRQVLEGSVKVIKFNIETAFDGVTMLLPVEKGVAIAGRGIVEMIGNKMLTKAVTGAFGAAEKAVIRTEIKGAYHQGMEFLDDGIRMFEQPLKETTEKSTTRFITTVDGITTDLKPTLDRIASEGSFPHRNDGSVFKNFAPKGHTEPLLPVKPLGYYKEFVHPTPGVKGPGAMRVVKGQEGEMWFTADHYKTFIPIK